MHGMRAIASSGTAHDVMRALALRMPVLSLLPAKRPSRLASMARPQLPGIMPGWKHGWHKHQVVPIARRLPEHDLRRRLAPEPPVGFEQGGKGMGLRSRGLCVYHGVWFG